MIITTLCALPFAAKAEDDKGWIDWRMIDSFDNSWQGAKIRVYDKTAGADICEMTFSEDESTKERTGSLCLPYEHTYQFIWVKGMYDSECGFYLTYRGIDIISKDAGKLNVADGTVLAEYEFTRGYNLWIGTTLVKSSNAADVFGDGKVKFSPETNTLTLNNFTFEGKGLKINNDDCYGGIVWDDNKNELTIELKGNNKIIETEAANHSDADTYGINSSGSLKFTGSGTLDVECCDADSFSAAIVSWGTLTIPATFTGAINAVSGKNEASSSNIGIYGSDGVDISGGTVTAVSYPAASSGDESAAVFSWGTVSLGANVTATASVNFDGSGAVDFNKDDYAKYKWFKSVEIPNTPQTPSAPSTPAKAVTPTAKLSATSYTYNGKVKTPSVTVKAGKTTLKRGTDYTVSYSKGRMAIGTYKVIITYKGKYSGKKVLTFKINPKGTTLSKVTTPKKARLKATWKKQTKQTTGYQIQYSTDKNFKKGNKTVTIKKNKTTSITIKKLKSKKKYYVRIRTYKTVGKTKYYSAWSKSKNVKVK